MHYGKLQGENKMSTILPNFDFRSLTQSLITKGMINQDFEQSILKKVSQPIPQAQTSVHTQTTTEPPQSDSVGGALPKDFPFSTLLEFPASDDWDSPIETHIGDYLGSATIFYNYLKKVKVDKLFPILKYVDMSIPEIYSTRVGKDKETILFNMTGMNTFSAVCICVKFIKGGLRIKLLKGAFVTKQFPNTDTLTLPKKIYDENIKNVIIQVIDKSFNEIWNHKETRDIFFNVPKVLQTLVGRSSLLDDDGGVNEVIANRIANNAVKPFSNATIDELDQLPMGTVMNIGDYILAKYSSNVETLYGLIDLDSGNYTDKAFDEFNLKLYGKAKGFDSPIILVDPNQNADILSIISKYNMLYPATLLKQLIANFQFKGTNTQFVHPQLTYAVGQEISDLNQIKSVVVPNTSYNGDTIFIINELGEIYRIKSSSSKLSNKVYPPNNIHALSDQELNTVFQKHTFKWLSFEKNQDNFSIFGKNIALVTTHYWAGYILKELFTNAILFPNWNPIDLQSNDAFYQQNKSLVSDWLKNQYIWEKHGSSLSLTIGGFGQYAILIDAKDDGSPYFMVQYLKNNTSVLRLLVSNQIDWQSNSDNQNGIPTGSKQVDQSLFQGKIPYNKNFAVPTINDAIEMIVTHLRQTAKTGFVFWEKADIKAMPAVQTVCQYYYSASSNNWSIKSVTIPSKLDGIVCGAMLVIPKGIGQEPKVFLVQQNGQWSIPMMNLTVGEEIESCAKDALQSMFIELPNDFEFSGASLSSTNKKDKSKVFHTVIFQVTETNANNWTPQITKGQKISGYAWVNASELEINTTASKLGDVSWKPTILDELSLGQDFIDKRKNQQTFEAILGAWKTHSDTWKKSAPIDPRLVKLIDPINLEQIKKFDGLYFDGIQYDFGKPPAKLFQLPNQSDLMPIEQRIAGFDGYKSNPRKNPIKTAKMAGYRQNGLGAVFRYDDNQMNHLVRLNPRRKVELGIHQNELDQYKPIVEKVLGVKNPSNDLLESAYALDSIGFALENAKRNPKDNSVMTLSLDEAKVVVQFADYVKLAVGGSEISPTQGQPTKDQSKLQQRFYQSATARQGNSFPYDGEHKIHSQFDGRSIAQWMRYIPLLRVLGFWKQTLDIGERIVSRGLGTALNSLLGGKNSFQPNEWSYGQLASMKKHFPNESSHLTDDLKDSLNLGNAIRLWMNIQLGKHGNMLVRHDLNPIWYPTPYVPMSKTILSVSDTIIQKRNNDNSSNPQKVDVPKVAVENPEYNIEGFWIDMFQYTWDNTTFTGFSSNIVWEFSYGSGQSMLLRSNTRDPRFLNKPLLSANGNSLGFASEKEVMFVYPDRTPLTLQIIGIAPNNTTTDQSKLIKLTDAQRLAWADARPPYRNEPYPKGKFSDFIKKI